MGERQQLYWLIFFWLQISNSMHDFDIVYDVWIKISDSDTILFPLMTGCY